MLTRRQLGLGLGALLVAATGTSSAAQVVAPERVRVGIMLLDLPEGAEALAAPAGWDWAANGPSGLEILVRGRTSFPTPDLAMARVLAPRPGGDVLWTVTNNPPQGIIGTNAYRVWSVRSTTAPVHTGALVAATLDGQTAVVLVTGPEGWSPSLRRGVLAGLEVRRES